MLTLLFCFCKPNSAKKREVFQIVTSIYFRFRAATASDAPTASKTIIHTISRKPDHTGKFAPVSLSRLCRTSIRQGKARARFPFGIISKTLLLSSGDSAIINLYNYAHVRR